MKETIYDKYIGEYVRIAQPSNPALGILRSIDFDRAILNPYFRALGTDFDTRAEICKADSVIPYHFIQNVSVLPDGEAFLLQLIRDARMKSRFDALLKLQDLKTKGISDSILEERIKELLGAS